MFSPQFPESTRDDRLRRNRLSAKKCRIKRKAHQDSLQDRVDSLECENVQLLRDNEELAAVLARLQSGQRTPTDIDTHTRKRPKRENGVTHSFDSSESAVFATSPQMEIPLLAMVTTLLCSAFATVWMTITSTTAAPVLAPAVEKTPPSRPPQEETWSPTILSQRRTWGPLSGRRHLTNSTERSLRATWWVTSRWGKGSRWISMIYFGDGTVNDAEVNDGEVDEGEGEHSRKSTQQLDLHSGRRPRLMAEDMAVYGARHVRAAAAA